jgi:hypothetical protein
MILLRDLRALCGSQWGHATNEKRCVISLIHADPETFNSLP